MNHLSVGDLDISLIIPCYNAVGKIGRCLASLRQIDLELERYEVIFIDDCSTDGTFQLLESQCANAPNWKVIRLATNSGSPSEPRNHGIAEARGDFVFFLDCDDRILSDTLRLHLNHARQTGADIVRGYLIAEIGGSHTIMNRLENWNASLTKVERIERILGQQSTTVCSLIRTDLLRRNEITWRSDLRMGEDTLFLVHTLLKARLVEYIDHPTFVYVKTPDFTPSSTQSYGNRELHDHLTVWQGSIAALEPLGIDYVTLRLQVGLRVALQAMIFINRGDIAPATFRAFVSFLHRHRQKIATFNLSARIKNLIAAIETGKYEIFRRAARPRLLIAGFDLKFITGILPQLEEFYEVRLDIWKAHDQHDEVASRKALDWAELIWCEWLLGNAVWYARNKKKHQKLIIRMHRFELGRDFGDRLEIAHVDAVVTVSTLFLERLLERFPSIPRSKARLQHNYIDIRSYIKSNSPTRHFRIGMIGILPSRKGFHRALEILRKLRCIDTRYTLDIYGHTAQNIPWLSKDSKEMDYFKYCEDFINNHGLSNAVHFRGHANLQVALAKEGVGIILSLSDSVREFPCSESFHLAVADGFAGGGLSLIRYWEGAEYIWPSRFILPTSEAIIARILEYRDNVTAYHADCDLGAAFISDQYSVNKFVESFKSLFREAV